MSQKIAINIWLNDERFKQLEKNGLGNMAEDRLAGMKMIRVFVSEEQKDKIMLLFPMAKYDSSTTGTIELLPRDAKDRLFDLCVNMRKTDEEVVDRFIEEEERRKK